MGHLQESVRREQIKLLPNFKKNLKMNKFALIVAFMVAGATAAVDRCNPTGDVNRSLLQLRFDENQDFACLKKLLPKGANVNAKDSYEYTPIMYAAKGSAGNALKVVQFLVTKGANVNAKNYYNTNALHYAVLQNNGQIVKFLIEKGAEGQVSDLLMLAVRYGKELIESVKVLVNKGADVNKVSGPLEYPYVKDSVLIIAAQNNYMKIVKFLLEKGANVQAPCHSRSWCLGKNTLMYAATHGNLDLVKILITKGLDVNAQDKVDGSTALMMAARNGHETVTEFLLEKGANPNFINDDGLSAMILASQNGQQVIVQQLKAKGAYMIDSYIFGFADLFPSFISDPVQRLRRLHRDNHVENFQGE